MEIPTNMPNVQGVLEVYDPVFSFLLREHKPLLLDLIKNMFDVALPLAALGQYFQSVVKQHNWVNIMYDSFFGFSYCI